MTLTTTQMIILGSIVLAIIIIVVIIVANTKKSELKKEINDINVRFNAIKTVPLAFKLNKAQAMAKRIEDTSEKIQSYYDRYSEAQKHIDEIGEMLEDIEDDVANNNKKQAKTTLETIKNSLDDLEKEVTSIDEFLEQFSKKENEERAISARLKEEYRELKMAINENSNYLAIAYDGVSKKLENVESLFSESEEWMYASDYIKAGEALDEIKEKIIDIKNSYEAIPDLVKDAKGVIPVLFDEVNRRYSLARQRGIYLEHLNIDDRLVNSQNLLNTCTKTLVDGDYSGVKETLENIKLELNKLLEELDKENQDFTDAKSIVENLKDNLEKIKSLYTYVDGSYKNENERFDMNEVGDYLKEVKADMDDYASEIIRIGNDLDVTIRPSSQIKEEINTLFNRSEEELEKLADYKHAIDKNSNDEERAKTQLIKLQVVLNEVEVKVLEYHLPAIASSYQEDLKSGRERIANIKRLLEEIPLDIDNLNKTLDEAIEYIYTFYNNVNNVVGMAIMVENAIVFGNKYRSTYSTVDRDLSKAEFSYLNGEYTKALTMAISCMETLFPNNANEKILEND